MTVITKAYGSIDVDERQKIQFPAGILGFESLKDFVLLDGEKEPYYWLQSTDSAGAAFILIDPFVFRPDYEMDINDEDLAEIGVTSPQNALFFTIVTIPRDGSPMTANLQGPIIINRAERLGKQVILNDPRWRTKHDIQQELAHAKKVSC